MKPKPIIYSDLDGSLLDEGYSFGPALDEIEQIKQKEIPIVLCTSKTLPEVLHYRRVAGLKDPFVVENGGAIYIEKDYFIKPPQASHIVNHFYVIEFGLPYHHLIQALQKVKKMGFKVRGFHEMTPEEVSALTGLDIEQSQWAKARQYDEVFLCEEDKDRLPQLKRTLEEMGLSHTFGRLHHIKGRFTKATAIKKLNELFRQHFQDIFTIGLGDGKNDSEMLREVDMPVVIRHPDGGFEPALLDIPKAYYTKAPGPEGWVEAIRILRKLGYL